jgi:hypothetical protein
MRFETHTAADLVLSFTLLLNVSATVTVWDGDAIRAWLVRHTPTQPPQGLHRGPSAGPRAHTRSGTAALQRRLRPRGAETPSRTCPRHRTDNVQTPRTRTPSTGSPRPVGNAPLLHPHRLCMRLWFSEQTRIRAHWRRDLSVLPRAAPARPQRPTGTIQHTERRRRHTRTQ